MEEINSQSIQEEPSKISVVLLCYNHENFIEQALDSILAQESIGEFDIIVGDDCSFDNSKKIIESYARIYSKRLKIISSEKNVGLIQNYIRCIKAVETEFFALLSADDYWIDKLKLKKQVDFLKENEEFSFVYTNYSSLNNESNIFTEDCLIKSKHEIIEGFVRDNLIDGNPNIMNITCCYRTSSFSEDFFQYLSDYRIQAEDFPSFMWAGFDGKIKYLSDITTVYRVNKNSITNSHNRKQKLNFVMSHVYIRNKFLDYKGYRPANWNQMQISTHRAILKFTANNFIGSDVAKSSFDFLKEHSSLSFKDFLNYLSLRNIFMNKLIKVFLFVIKRIGF